MVSGMFCLNLTLADEPVNVFDYFITMHAESVSDILNRAGTPFEQ